MPNIKYESLFLNTILHGYNTVSRATSYGRGKYGFVSPQMVPEGTICVATDGSAMTVCGCSIWFGGNLAHQTPRGVCRICYSEVVQKP